MNNNNIIKIVEPNKGKHIAVPCQINTIVASKKDTGGTYSFIECKVFPGAGPVPHIQTHEHEGFYLVEGQLTFTVDNPEHSLIYHQMFGIHSKMKLMRLQN